MMNVPSHLSFAIIPRSNRDNLLKNVLIQILKIDSNLPKSLGFENIYVVSHSITDVTLMFMLHTSF